MKEYTIKILEYIFEANRRNMETENIHIFVNKYTKKNIYIVEQLVERFKTVNIITENLKFYKRLEKIFYDKGILITVSNNKKKSARNANFIINMDFEKDTFEKYSINMNSIIINMTNEKVFFNKLFNGILINNFEISIDEDKNYFIDEFYGNINKKVYLETIFLSEEDYYGKAEELYNMYRVEILMLYGVRGPLSKWEFLMQSIDKKKNLF